MLRCLLGAIVVLATLSLAQGAPSALVQKKRNVTKHWHGYGFLPGYRHPKWSNAIARCTTTGFTARDITAQRGRAFIAEDGTAAGSVLVGRRRRLGRCGIVADSTE